MVRSTNESEKAVLAIAVFLVTFLSLNYRLTGVWGEADAAWLGVIALDWKSGHRDFDFYAGRTSPLYVYLIEFFLSFLSPLQIPDTMNLLNALAAIPFVWGSHVTWKVFLPTRAVAASHWLALFFPSTWMMRIFGFPTGIACALWMCGTALLFTQKSRAGAIALFALAVGFKADLVLLTPALLWWAVRLAPKRTPTSVGLSIAGPPLGIALSLIHSHIMFTSTPLEGAARRWTKAFEYTWAHFADSSNLLAVLHSMGAAFAIASVVGLLWILVFRPARRDFVLLLVIWFAGPALFWQGRVGNSSRHLAAACIALAPLIALFLHEISQRFTLALLGRQSRQISLQFIFVLALGLTLSNYVSIPQAGPNGSNESLLAYIYHPPSRLLDIRSTLQDSAARLHRRQISSAEKWWEIGYSRWEARARQLAKEQQQR